MRSYNQYCPVARGAEVFAERWMPVIMRNILYGCETFNAIADGAPGLSRSLLMKRLRELERAGVITVAPKEDGRGSKYVATEAGRALKPVLNALGVWGEMWMDVRPVHTEPGIVLWSWGTVFLNRDALPRRRVVVRFEFEYAGKRDTAWLLLENGDGEVCATDPGYGDDLVVEVHDTMALARWHLGHIEWNAAVRSGGIVVHGPTDLRRALPTWNLRPLTGHRIKQVKGSAKRTAEFVYGLAPTDPTHEPGARHSSRTNQVREKSARG
jgi:DNA-binding HxlR family transcriptional regulator